jgi:hypothetical protein
MQEPKPQLFRAGFFYVLLLIKLVQTFKVFFDGNGGKLAVWKSDNPKNQSLVQFVQ